MNITLKAAMMKEWTVTDEGITVGREEIPYSEMTGVSAPTHPSALINGVLQITLKNGKLKTLGASGKFARDWDGVVEFVRDRVAEANGVTRRKPSAEGAVYDIEGVRGRHIWVYEDRAVIKTTATFGTLLVGNASDGEKTIYYADCVGVQFKESGLQIGYLQLETASALMNNKGNNFFNENSFTFDTSKVSNDKMAEVADYVRERVRLAKNPAPAAAAAPSAADEILKFKQLLDAGILTQEEFDAKKKQLLGL